MTDDPSHKKESEDGNVKISEAKMRWELDSLHQEMEIAQHGIARNGQFRRKVPRDQSLVRTRKRKILESQDYINLDEDNIENVERRSRLRGSMVASEDRVINQSLVFGIKASQRNDIDPRDADLRLNDEGKGKCQDEMSEDDAISNEYSDTENEDENAGDETEVPAVVDDDDDDDEGSDEEDEESDEEGADDVEKKSLGIDKVGDQAVSSTLVKKAKRKRRTYRLRNFKSQRLAQKHGAALGAHALGRPLEAIQKLKQVAREVPSAPQIYSSLGMVYEDMLQTSQRNRALVGNSNETEQKIQQVKSRRVGVMKDVNIPDPALEEQLDLAKKTYGAYHVSAILYKRDYSLWLRAADSALEIANIHSSIMELSTIPDSVREYHRVERRRWLEEAKNDYQSADNLHPPGIDIPGKLAFVMMELGLLADALTLLSDLKSSKEFFSSYKAWLLYSDLMLRLGHECMQWNKGLQNHGNYMFRRWLRKLAKSFDWKERRLQALSKALEAACGSKACSRLIQWLKQRIRVEVESNNDDERWHASTATESELGGDVVLVDIHSRSESDPFRDNYHGGDVGVEDDKINEEKSLLTKRHEIELACFDETTRELELESNSIAATERGMTRENLLKQHDESLQHLLAEFKVKNDGPIDETIDNTVITKEDEGWDSVLPLSASCQSVCDIASELMRHMLVMNLYSGGRLVGECTSEYFKERYQLRENRKEKRRKQESASTEAFRLCDDEKEEVWDDESDDRLSDDDELDYANDSAFMQSLKKGTLPPELKVLYGICLFGEGNKDFAAASCLKDIDLLELESRSWLTEKIIDTGVTPDNVWILFHQSMTEPFGRTAMYAFVSDIIRNTQGKNGFSFRVAPLFRNQVVNLTESGVVDDVLRGGTAKSSLILHRRNVVIKVLLAAASFEVDVSETKIAHVGNTDAQCDITLLSDVLDTLTYLFGFVWKIEPKAKISTTSVEAVEALSRATRLLPLYTDQIKKGLKKRFLLDVVNRLMPTVSKMCGCKLKLKCCDTISIQNFNEIPLKSSWLTTDLSRVALRAFNLCVATNVSLFSGWEHDEFNVRLLRQGLVPSFFGISMTDNQITGYLSIETEASLSQQWQLILEMYPSLSFFSFDKQLSIYRETTDYKETRERVETTKMKHSISCYGEENALGVLLSFSHSCLLLATEENDVQQSQYLSLLAISILLPVSEFCLNKTLWDSDVGRGDSQSNLNDWRSYDWDKDDVAPANRPGYLRPKQRPIFHIPSDSKALHEWFGGENDMEPLSNLICLPLSMLQQEWKKGCFQQSNPDLPNPRDAMEKLDSSLKQLRCCFSEVAVEKGCLNVAFCLLQVASTELCQNVFLCIQQAAMFASQAGKGGSNDQPFQSPLPLKETCTPHEAVMVIGRAGCLQAVGLHQEAAFLCSYVASCCSIHRDRQQSEYKWNVAWRLIAILAYDLSVVLRNAANVMIQDQDRHEDTSGTWEKDIISELKRARADGLVWKLTLSNITVDGSVETDQTKVVSPKDLEETSRPAHNTQATVKKMENKKDLPNVKEKIFNCTSSTEQIRDKLKITSEIEEV